MDAKRADSVAYSLGKGMVAEKQHLSSEAKLCYLFSFVMCDSNRKRVQGLERLLIL
jgi:hypothetical protein